MAILQVSAPNQRFDGRELLGAARNAMLRSSQGWKMPRGVRGMTAKYRSAWPMEAPHAIERDGSRLSLLTLCLPFPPSLNTYWRHLKNGRTLISEGGRIYRAHVCSVALVHRLAKSFPDQRLCVEMDLVMPDRRTRDIDNSAKVIFDALTASRVWTDDSQVDELHMIRKGVSPPGFVILTISAI